MAVGLVLSVIGACSSGGGSGGTGGGSGSGAGVAGAGGTGTGTAGGGAAGSAGGGGTGGGGRTGSGVPGTPMGGVWDCFGDCPLGECGQSGPLRPHCDAVYTGPVDASTMYCNAGQTGGYCLVAGDNADYFSINCASGVATILFCTRGGCGAGMGSAMCDF
jgi:hypothetical protein